MPASDMGANIAQKVNERVQHFKNTQQIQNGHIQSNGNRMENHEHYGNKHEEHKHDEHKKHHQGDPYPMPTVVASATDIVSATLSGGRPAKTEIAIEVRTRYKYDFVTVTKTVTAKPYETEKPYYVSDHQCLTHITLTIC